MPQEVDDITLAFPAEVLSMMPPMEEIPEQFKGSLFAPAGTDWNRLFRDLFYFGLTDLELVPKEGIDPAVAWRHLRCIIGSYEPRQEHKEAAFAYLCSEWYESGAWKARAK